MTKEPEKTKAIVAPDHASDPEGYAAYVAALNAKRVPFGSFQQKLAYPKREGYYRYWFNDEPGRVQQATDAGYTHVKDQSTGAQVKRVVGKSDAGGALYAYLMEIPTVIWEEDMQAQRRQTDETEAAIKRSKAIVANAKEAAEDQGAFYVPGGGSKVESGIGRRRS